MLDIQVFVKHFAPAFSITHRFVGSEPLSPLTGHYNEVLRENLPIYGITLEQIPRLEQNGTPISASAVRAALTAGDWDTVRSLVPQTTFEHLQTIIRR
jgi:[citrate (pro-3S)-lyase] ligase